MELLQEVLEERHQARVAAAAEKPGHEVQMEGGRLAQPVVETVEGAEPPAAAQKTGT